MKRPALLLLLAFAPVAAQAAQPFSAERSWEIQRIGNPETSPDGRHIVAPVTRAVLADDKLLTDLWLWSTDGKTERALTSDPAAESSPRFSPDGQTLAFIAQRDDDKAPQLYLLPLAGGEPRRLTTFATGVSVPRWAGNGRLVFASRVWADLALDKQAARLKEREESKMKAQVWDGGPVAVWDTLQDDREGHVFAVDIASGAVTPLTLGRGLQLPRFSQGYENTFDISPDGRELAMTADTNPARNVTDVDVYLLPVAGGPARNLSAGNVDTDTAPAYSPDGRHLAFLQQRVPGFYAAKARVMLHDRRGGGTRELHADWDRSAGPLAWSRDGRTLYSVIDDAGTFRAYELPLAGKPRALTGESSFGGLSVGPQGIAALRQSFAEPPTLVSIDPRSGQATKLSRLNDALMADTTVGRFESVTYAGADGDPIQMWVNYPPGFDRSKKYPVFVLIHGGPHNAVTNSMQFRWNAQVFGSWGYVTAWPNFHGSSGFGEAFTDSINPEWAEKPYQDVIKASQWLAAQPWADAERMVAGGGSYGGYLTSVILGREHPFKALVAHAKVYNLYSQYAADFGTTVPRFGGFWEEGNREVLERNSPHLAAGNFDTPTLVIHGQRDLRVPVNHGFELFQTLLVKGVPTRLVYFPDENHWVLKPQNSVFWYAQVKRWLDEHNPPGAAGTQVAVQGD
ncbi:alpha/beta hydrolase family protein [Arenimonas terrae]|uniref:Acyl-peptide hydrolase n=1 Tax=Arenimonas terrae TaxID=2546226 RepID=A0A5C4RNM6_9GAMM|nr:S9 family peptidase [Arenimonas terrae]TNJ32856.1 S9 family peptidase [Arenimonas terrae]